MEVNITLEGINLVNEQNIIFLESIGLMRYLKTEDMIEIHKICKERNLLAKEKRNYQPKFESSRFK